jgi:hypothetical protein
MFFKKRKKENPKVYSLTGHSHTLDTYKIICKALGMRPKKLGLKIRC